MEAYNNTWDVNPWGTKEGAAAALAVLKIQNLSVCPFCYHCKKSQCSAGKTRSDGQPCNELHFNPKTVCVCKQGCLQFDHSRAETCTGPTQRVKALITARKRLGLSTDGIEVPVVGPQPSPLQAGQISAENAGALLSYATDLAQHHTSGASSSRAAGSMAASVLGRFGKSLSDFQAPFAALGGPREAAFKAGMMSITPSMSRNGPSSICLSILFFFPFLFF
jgi:hypothetical protein